MSRRDHQATRKRPGHIVLAAGLTSAMVGLFGVAMAPLVAIVHVPGFFGGFGRWLSRPLTAIWERVKVPYALAVIA